VRLKFQFFRFYAQEIKAYGKTFKIGLDAPQILWHPTPKIGIFVQALSIIFARFEQPQVKTIPYLYFASFSSPLFKVISEIINFISKFVINDFNQFFVVINGFQFFVTFI